MFYNYSQTVSYTHLDVYKRQEKEVSSVEEIEMTGKEEASGGPDLSLIHI